VVKLEGVEELEENFFLGLLAGSNFRMMLSIVDTLDIIDFNGSIAISIELIEGSFDEGFSHLIHLSHDASHKFIIVDVAITVDVEEIEKFSTLFRGDLDSEIAHSFPELRDFQGTIAIIIHNLKDSLHS
jgi:hypothetical protein